MASTEYNLIFCTKSYPYSKAVEGTFIDPEISCLNSSFKSIILLPESIEGKKQEIPSNILISTDFANVIQNRSFTSIIETFLQVIISPYLYKELFKNPAKTMRIYSIIQIIENLAIAIRTKKWILKYIGENNIDLKKTIFYTYWLNKITIGLCLAKQQCPDIKIISRAHGGDLYEERSPFSYIPFRPIFFPYIDKIFADSIKGKDYLINKFPEYSPLFSTARLGVPQQGFFSEISNDKVFRIVSCSFLVPVKRIDLLIKGLEILGKKNTDKIFEWTHIGDGPLRSELEKLAEKRLPKNLNYRFLGYVPEGGVISYYKNNMIDVFINVSSSEGTPVSIMEAQSCGIPVIATDVGGNSEIVDEFNGAIISKDPDPSEIAKKIIMFLTNTNQLKGKKVSSYHNWNTYYNSEKNHTEFIRDMINSTMNGK